MNRAQRRHKVKDRSGSTKGKTKVIFMDQGQPRSRYVKAGSKVHQQAINNSKQFRKGARGE